MAAYGENGKWEGRAERVLEELRDVEVHCLSTTQGEYPVHPLQQRGRRLTDHVLYRARRSWPSAELDRMEAEI